MGKIYSTNNSNKRGCNVLIQNGKTPKLFLPRRAGRILERRYVLSSNQYLEIGISVGADSYVELILGEEDLSELILPIPTWNLLMHKRADVERLAQSAAATPVEDFLVMNIKEALVDGKMEQMKQHFVAPIEVHDLKIDITSVATFFSSFETIDVTVSNFICMRPLTVLHLFHFCDCIKNMHLRLSENICLVNDKFKKFVTVLECKNITNVSDAVKTIRESDAFDSRSLVDCELLTCAINDILYAACNK